MALPNSPVPGTLSPQRIAELIEVIPSSVLSTARKNTINELADFILGASEAVDDYEARWVLFLSLVSKLT